jgi:hypothetical protein
MRYGVLVASIVVGSLSIFVPVCWLFIDSAIRRDDWFLLVVPAIVGVVLFVVLKRAVAELKIERSLDHGEESLKEEVEEGRGPLVDP